MKKIVPQLLKFSKFNGGLYEKRAQIYSNTFNRISRCFTTDKKHNLTAVLYGVEDLRLEQRPIPELCDNEVLLEMDTVGICGSDVHFLTKGGIGDFVVKKPMVIGHEAAGIVCKLGPNVKNLKVGDRVAIEPGVPCRMCAFCKKGDYNLCSDMKFCATPPTDGNLTRYFKHAADFCYKLPDHVSTEEGALLEPLSVGVHACRRAGVGLNSSVLILGDGPIGLVTLITARAMGASSVIITGQTKLRMDIAKQLCATHTLLIKPEDKPKDVVKQVEKLCGGIKPDITIDCVANQETINLGILATRNGGNYTVVGMGTNEAKIPIMDAIWREVEIRGSFRYCNDYPAALAMVATGKADVKRLITHHFDITETAEAFETARHCQDTAIKILIHPKARK